MNTSGSRVAAIALSVPFATVTSASVKPVGTSLKVKVTSESSPMLSAVSSTTIETVGAVVSRSAVSPVPLAVLLEVSVTSIEAVTVPSLSDDRLTLKVPLPSPLTTTGPPPPLEVKVTSAVASGSMPETTY